MSDMFSMMPICINRHDAGISIAFCDASVRKVGLKELWTLKWQVSSIPPGRGPRLAASRRKIGRCG